MVNKEPPTDDNKFDQKAKSVRPAKKIKIELCMFPRKGAYEQNIETIKSETRTFQKNSRRHSNSLVCKNIA